MSMPCQACSNKIDNSQISYFFIIQVISITHFFFEIKINIHLFIIHLIMSVNGISKYKTQIILFILYIIFWIIFVPFIRSPTFLNLVDATLTRFVPAEDVALELVIIFLIILPISSIISLFIGGYILTPIVIILHRAFFKNKMFYWIC